MALVFTIVAISQKLNDAIKGISIVYVIFILYTLSSENTSFKKDQDISSINIIDYNETEGYDLSEDISNPQNNFNNEFDSLNIDELIKDNISIELIDLRVISPIKYDLIINSIHKTKRFMVINTIFCCDQ